MKRGLRPSTLMLIALWMECLALSELLDVRVLFYCSLAFAVLLDYRMLTYGLRRAGE